MYKVSLLLPAVFIESIGTSLEDFFREIVLAAKRASDKNLYYRIYPLSLGEEELPAVVKDSTEVARITEHRLARYAVLPQEKNILRLYQKMRYDLLRPGYPVRFRKKNFWEYYLSRVEFPLLEDALDTLFWVLARGTTRKLTAEQGIRLMKELFQQYSGMLGEEMVWLSERGNGNPGIERTETFEETIPLTTATYPTDVLYLVVCEDDAPIEGRNTVLVKFYDAPPRATLTVFLPHQEWGVTGASSAEREALRGYLHRVLEQRFDRKALWKLDKQVSRSQTDPSKEAEVVI